MARQYGNKKNLHALKNKVNHQEAQLEKEYDRTNKRFQQEYKKFQNLDGLSVGSSSSRNPISNEAEHEARNAHINKIGKKIDRVGAAADKRSRESLKSVEKSTKKLGQHFAKSDKAGKRITDGIDRVTSVDSDQVDAVLKKADAAAAASLAKKMPSPSSNKQPSFSAGKPASKPAPKAAKPKFTAKKRPLYNFEIERMKQAAEARLKKTAAATPPVPPSQLSDLSAAQMTELRQMEVPGLASKKASQENPAKYTAAVQPPKKVSSANTAQRPVAMGSKVVPTANQNAKYAAIKKTADNLRSLQDKNANRIATDKEISKLKAEIGRLRTWLNEYPANERPKIKSLITKKETEVQKLEQSKKAMTSTTAPVAASPIPKASSSTASSTASMFRSLNHAPTAKPVVTPVPANAPVKPTPPSVANPHLAISSVSEKLAKQVAPVYPDLGVANPANAVAKVTPNIPFKRNIETNTKLKSDAPEEPTPPRSGLYPTW